MKNGGMEVDHILAGESGHTITMAARPLCRWLDQNSRPYPCFETEPGTGQASGGPSPAAGCTPGDMVQVGLAVEEELWPATWENSPTITPPSLLYFLFPSCFSMLSLSLEKLVTCGVIRSYNCFTTEPPDMQQKRPLAALKPGLRWQCASCSGWTSQEVSL